MNTGLLVLRLVVACRVFLRMQTAFWHQIAQPQKKLRFPKPKRLRLTLLRPRLGRGLKQIATTCLNVPGFGQACYYFRYYSLDSYYASYLLSKDWRRGELNPCP